ncbi:MAG: hypothetical protein ACI3U8_02205 [Candidatus Onthomonas sp.]
MTEEEKINSAICDLLGRMEQDDPGLIGRLNVFGEMQKGGYDSAELDEIWKRYLKHVGPVITILVYDLYIKSLLEGFSDQAAKAAIRLGLSMEYKEPEYFTSEEVADSLGVSVEEINRIIEEHRQEMLENGCLVEVNPAPWLTGLLQEGGADQ